ncbi:MAG: hypothetical protein WAV78_00430, partial [Xanthobacteraceae bacterium]
TSDISSALTFSNSMVGPAFLFSGGSSNTQKRQLITDVDQKKITPWRASSGIRSEITWAARTAR